MYKNIFFAKTIFENKNGGILLMEMLKHISITGSSTTSWKDAIFTALEEASKSIDYLKNVEIKKQYATISGNKIETYIVDLDVSFTIDSSRK